MRLSFVEAALSMQVTIETAGPLAFVGPAYAMRLADVSRHRLGDAAFSRGAYAKPHAFCYAAIVNLRAGPCLCGQMPTSANKQTRDCDREANCSGAATFLFNLALRARDNTLASIVVRAERKNFVGHDKCSSDRRINGAGSVPEGLRAPAGAATRKKSGGRTCPGCCLSLWSRHPSRRWAKLAASPPRNTRNAQSFLSFRFCQAHHSSVKKHLFTRLSWPMFAVRRCKNTARLSLWVKTGSLEVRQCLPVCPKADLRSRA